MIEEEARRWGIRKTVWSQDGYVLAAGGGPGCAGIAGFAKESWREIPMSKLRLPLEVWIDFAQKVISFRQIEGWEHLAFGNQDTLLEQLDRFSSQGFRFQ